VICQLLHGHSKWLLSTPALQRFRRSGIACGLWWNEALSQSRLAEPQLARIAPGPPAASSLLLLLLRLLPRLPLLAAAFPLQWPRSSAVAAVAAAVGFALEAVAWLHLQPHRR